jgi:hypothetical protein
VWEAALEVALKDLETSEDPARTINILTLKGGALARSLLDDLGQEKTAALLGQLLLHHGGGTFAREDLVAAGREIGVDLEETLEEWLAMTALPGFVGEKARAVRLPDGEDSSPRYQLTVRVRNDEPVPGLIRVAYWQGQGRDAFRQQSEPIRLEGPGAIDYGVVLSQPPTVVVVEPYLSLNRDAFRVELGTVDEETIVRQDAFEGVREVPWDRPGDELITVDDLDQGFSITEGDGRRGVRLDSRTEDENLDQGLPAQNLGAPPARWSRFASASAWGRYRHTTAAVRPGAGKKLAVFTAELPHAGSWELEMHLPSKRRFFARSWGEWSLEIVDGSGRNQVSFDSNAASQGWNSVGAFEVDGGEVSVELSDKAKGQVVVADAIRWRPSSGAVTVEQP